MLALYLFSVLVGGVLLAAAAFGGHGHDHGDIHHGGLGDGHADHDGATKFFSLRTITYFLFVFGGVGSALSWAWKGASSWLVFPIALVAGLSVGAVVGFTFKYLAQTESGQRSGEESFVGLPARVVLPIAPGGSGKVVVQRGNRSYELIARPLDSDAQGITGWKSVVVVEMNRGTAIVAPMDEPMLQEGS